MKYRLVLLFFSICLLAARAPAQTASFSASLTAQSTDCSVSNSCLSEGVTKQGGPPPGSASITVSGTFSATLQFEASGDGGATWQSINAIPVASSIPASSATAPGLWQLNVAGLTNIRVRCSSFVSGTAVTTISFSSASARSNGGGGSSANNLPSGTDAGTANDYNVTLSPALATVAATPAEVNVCQSLSARSSCSYSGHVKGDIVIAYLNATSTTQPTFGISNTLGYSWLPVNSGCALAGTAYSQMFYAYVPATTISSDTFTETSSVGTAWQLIVTEFSGVAQTNPIDGTGGCVSGGPTTGTFTTSSFTGTTGDLVFAGGIAPAISGPTAGSGFTSPIGPAFGGFVEFQIAASSSITASMVIAGTSTFVIQAIAIKAGTQNQFGQSFTFVAAHSNTGASTATVNGVPERIQLMNYLNAFITGGEIVAGNTYQLTNDGAEWLLAGALNSGQQPPLPGGSLNLAGAYLVPSTVGAANTSNPGLTIISPPGSSGLDDRNMLTFLCGPNVGGTGCGGHFMSMGIDHDNVFLMGGSLELALLQGFEAFGPAYIYSQGSTGPDILIQPNNSRSSTDVGFLLTRPTVGSDGANVFGLDSLTGKIENFQRCASSASPAVCGTAWSGFVTIAAGVATVTVDTTAVDANSKIFVSADDTIGTPLGVTCNTTLATMIAGYAITNRVAGTSFQITWGATPSTNPLCLSFHVED